MLVPVLTCGLLLGFCGLPLPWSALTPLPLALALWLVSGGEDARACAGRAFWLMSAYFAVQLWWLTHFMANLTGLPWGGVLVLPLFLLEGVFWGLMAALVTWPFRDRLARVWALGAGWVVLEWLRTLGPLAFPWSGVGPTLLPTPISQTADLWGELGLSVLVVFVAVSLVSLARRRFAAPAAAAVVLLLGWAYGVTRQPGSGPQGQALVLRSTFDTFAKASGALTPQQLVARLKTLSAVRRPNELLIWSETAIQQSALLPQVPAPGLYGVATASGVYPDTYREWNTAQSWDGAAAGAAPYTKIKLVPLGEYYPLAEAARPVYTFIFGLLQLPFAPPERGTQARPLSLMGVRYGTYICYDSIFSWVARQMTRSGAQVLVNISNDGWYTGWGVTQHFQLGRLRAIETRRWVLRSVNEGVAASIDDLGRPVLTLDHGEGALHASYRVLDGQSVYVRVGDVPALVLALLMLVPAVLLQRRQQRARLYR